MMWLLLEILAELCGRIRSAKKWRVNFAIKRRLVKTSPLVYNQGKESVRYKI